MRLFPVLLLVAALPACAEPPRLRLSPDEFVAADGTKVRAELGELRVPENRSKPGSRTITLQFVRFAATGAKPGAPIVYLAGGPGGSGIEAARGTRFPLFMALRQVADVIALDQRGTGLRGGDDPETDCDEEYVVDPGAPADRAKAGAAIAEAARRCLDRLRRKGFDIAGYTTPESAADLDDLRQALGADKLTLWGISYGTHLALATLRRFGDHVDRVILAGVEGPDDTYKLPSDQQELLEAIAELARPQTPDLLGSIRNLLRDLEARPRTVPLTHPLTGKTFPLVLGPLDLQVVIAQMLTGPETFATLPDLVSRLERGDWLALALQAGRLRFGEAPTGMSMAMDCASGLTDERRTRIATEAKQTLLGDAINVPLPEICAAVPVADLGDAYRAPVRSAVPALLISGTLDGRTRPRQAEALLPGMPKAVHLVIEGAGHSDPLFLSSPKILETMLRFLRGEAIVERRITLPPVRLIPPRTVVTLPEATLRRYVGGYRIPDGGVRRVVQAGNVLYTVRDRGTPFPIRPSAENEFFYEGTPDSIRFEVDAEGRVEAMLFRRGDGPEQRCPRN
jgi:pimeloyl-ACP methyl ester carboxylesterase